MTIPQTSIRTLGTDGRKPTPSLTRGMRERIVRRLRERREDVASAWLASQFSRERLERFSVPGWQEQSPEKLSSLFIQPLLSLLAAYLETGDPAYGDLYLDERLRYAPHQAAPGVRVEFFQEVLPADEEAVRSVMDDGSEGEAVHAALREIHAPLVTPPAGKTLRILAMGDCLMNELRVFLAGECRRHDMPLDFRSLYFSARQGRGIAADQALDFLGQNPMDQLALSFLTYLGIPPYMSLMRSADELGASEIQAQASSIVGLIRAFLEQIRERTDATFLLHNASGLPLGRYRRRLPFVATLSAGRKAALTALNEGIAELAEATPNTILIDEAGVATHHGLRRCEQSVVPQAHPARAVPRPAVWAASSLSPTSTCCGPIESYRRPRSCWWTSTIRSGTV